MRIVNEKLLDEFRQKARCEWCRKACPNGCDPHHLFSRGAGRLDIRENLAALCRTCHTANHNGYEPTRNDLLAIVAARENTAQDEIKALIYRLRRACHADERAGDGCSAAPAEYYSADAKEAGGNGIHPSLPPSRGVGRPSMEADEEGWASL